MTRTGWGLDLGTHNTLVSRWNPEEAHPEILDLPGISRRPQFQGDLTTPGVIPSATHIDDDGGILTRLSSLPWIAEHVAWGRRGFIGEQAIELNQGRPSAAFVPTFKHWLGRASLAPVAKSDGRSITAREVEEVYLRELFATVRREHGDVPDELVVTAPVEVFEGYRAEVAAILQKYGVNRVRWLDEPVAAAIGYGVGIGAERRILVVDAGAGTFHLALMSLPARGMEAGRADVLAKVGRPVGGNHVDGWILDDLLAGLSTQLPEAEPFWRQMLLDETRRVKEASYSRGRELFIFHPEVQPLLAARRARGGSDEVWVDQDRIRGVLEARGFFTMLQDALAELPQGPLDAVDDVLLVGGSTLLPGVFPLFEERFGRDRVRGWRPFEAVALGAATFAAGAITMGDTLAHDYAIAVWSQGQVDPTYVPVIRRGTRLPTAPDHWRRQLVPTCAQGTPETFFKLVISELGAPRDDERLFGWDAAGKVRVLQGGEERLVVPLNEANPTLGTLDPPHLPGDKTPRLDVSFGVDADRWLVATVRDLKTDKVLLDAQPVVRVV